MTHALKVSRFAHTIECDPEYSVALNALTLGVSVVPRAVADVLIAKTTLSHPLRDNQGRAVDPTQLIAQRILVDGAADDADLARAIAHLGHAKVGILYLLLTDACNIACRYCYMDPVESSGGSVRHMSVETARCAIDAFARCIPDSIRSGISQPQIILYGGEPLLNWTTVSGALLDISDRISRSELPRNTAVTLNTNGMLITRDRAQVLSTFDFLTVAVSVDGPANVHDRQRVDHAGKGTYLRVREAIGRLRDAGANVGLCCTLSATNVEEAPAILRWLHSTFEVKAMGFNLLIDNATLGSSSAERSDYAAKAAIALCESFRVARELGVYEDRMMRKVNSFVRRQTYYYDCGAFGQQMVVSPRGTVGVCQGYCGEGKYFVPLTEQFTPCDHPIWVDWRRRSPVNMPACLECVALGNCGGGCAYTVDRRTGSIWGVDDVFCEFSRSVVRFLARDLVSQMRSHGRFASGQPGSN